MTVEEVLSNLDDPSMREAVLVKYVISVVTGALVEASDEMALLGDDEDAHRAAVFHEAAEWLLRRAEKVSNITNEEDR